MDIISEVMYLTNEEMSEATRLIKEGMLQQGMLQQCSRYEPMVESLNERIMSLQQISLELLEKKSEGLEVISIDIYEELLNWSIENLRIIRDYIE